MEHGKRWSFVKYKCRCLMCVAANDAYMIAYREKNKAKILAKETERYQRNKEKIIERVGEYYLRENAKVKRRRSSLSGKAKQVAHQEARRARQLGQFVEAINPVVVYSRANGVCGICRKSIVGDFHMDHIVPLARGGLHAYRNIQPTHPKCNVRKKHRLPTLEELETA